MMTSCQRCLSFGGIRAIGWVCQAAVVYGAVVPLINRAQFTGQFMEPSSPSSLSQHAHDCPWVLHWFCTRSLFLGLQVTEEKARVLGSFCALAVFFNACLGHAEATEPQGQSESVQ